MAQDPSEGSGYLPVADFYSGKSVFITGATGFLGKAYVEKLAYACVDIDRIFILMRTKKGLSMEERMRSFLNQPIFTRLKRDYPEALKKIIPISGDVTACNLGISPEDEQMLIEEVSVVIHAAGNIKFNEILKIILKVNVEGTRSVLTLAQRMKKIQAFVYVSTAYSNTKRKILEEIMYPPPAELSEIKKFAEQHHILGGDDEEIKRVLNGHPNTYTFSKALAETLVAENHGDMPVVIIRPSIISASVKEPAEGWVDSKGGATAFFTFNVKLLNHVVYTKRKVVLDMIPLDYVCNLTLVAIARCQSSKAVAIYNSCSSWANPIDMDAIYRITGQYLHEYKIKRKGLCFCPPLFVVFTKHKSVAAVFMFLMQTSPSFVADLSLKCKGKQPKYIKQQSMMTKVCEAMQFFTEQTWVMKCERTQELSATLSPSDLQVFPCDPAHINWPDYIYNYLSGIRKYLLKEQ